MASTSHSVPFTPRASTKSSRYRASGATLSTREENKISHTLASVRKGRPISSLLQSQPEEDSDANDDSVLHPARGGPSTHADGRRPTNGGPHRSSRGKEREVTFGGDQSYSMLPEQSFRARPLSSRLPPPVPTFSPSKMSASGEEESTRPRESQLEGVPLEVQEAMVLQDLLSVLLGIEGNLITFDPAYEPSDVEELMKGPEWVVDPGLDPSLSSVLRRILPLATYYMAIEAFVDSRCLLDFGKVNHALGSGLRGMLQEYTVLLTQIETLFLTSPTFTLQKAFFHLHPTIHSLSLLHSLTNLLFHADDEEESDSESEESSIDSDAERLGLGGKRTKVDGLEYERLVLGGEVLQLIWQMGRNRSGDPTAKSIFSKLLLHASQPYAEMLIDWMSSGHLTDNYKEFMVSASKDITKKQTENDATDQYWQDKYTLRDKSVMGDQGVPRLNRVQPRPGTEADPRLPGGACIPRFLQPWKHKILLAGKYLNVIRECGVDDREGREGELASWGTEGGMIDLESETFHRRIEEAYIHANKTLLKMLIEDEDLLAHLRSMKHHFFLSQSSFITQFLDSSSLELLKFASVASDVKLQSLLDLALRTSGEALAENLGDEVKIVKSSTKLFDKLIALINQTGDIDVNGGIGKSKEESGKGLLAFEALELDYLVKFPVSLVISRQTVARYQILFRFLFQLKHAELALTRMWSSHTQPAWRIRHREPYAAGFEDWKKRVFALRMKMLAFVQQTMAFVSGEVLEPNWRELEEKLGKVGTVDRLLEDHVGFLDTCTREAGMTSKELIGLTSRLLAVIQNFTHQTKHLNDLALRVHHLFDPPRDKKGDLIDPDWVLREEDPKDVEARFTKLATWEKNFGHNLKVHIERVTFAGGNENTALTPLVVRLNQFRL